MNKILIGTIIMFLLSFFFVSNIYAQQCGDLNQDGSVDIIDALLIAQIFVGIDVGDYDECWADADGDGEATIIDALLIAQYFVGLLDEITGCQNCRQQPSIPADEATKQFIANVVPQVKELIDMRKGAYIHRKDDFLPAGSVVEVSVESGIRFNRLVCKNPSWLFFVDLDPLAHFGHPTQIWVMDGETGDVQVINSDWWPEVDGKAQFGTLEERRNSKTMIFREDSILNFDISWGDVLSDIPLKFLNPCDAWAVLVCGYNDLPDTFDEDTNDMYSLLKALGLQDDHIFYVSPHTGHPGVDRATSIANVEWAINQVAASADESDKVLFLYSSHGNIDLLSCVPGSPGGGSISGSNLDDWLDGITCNEMSIIIEACHSGSLIGRYKNGNYVAAEDNLTGDGETNRCVFTSASTDTSSYPDVDWASDPNPADVGSETIHAYIEAFYKTAADSNFDGKITFQEAFDYAWDMDCTRIDGINTQQMTSTGLNPHNLYNYCNTGYSDTVVITHLSPSSPATILLNQEVDITFSYSISDPSGARIFIRPMTGSSPTPGYSASGSPLYTNSGSDTAMFRITSGNNVRIDRLRIQVYDADQTSLYFQDYVNVDYTVIAARAWINSLSPQSPSTVPLNQEIDITFGYETGLPAGCRVFIRPMTNGSLTPGYAASGSPLYTGSGTDTAMFRITSGNNVHIDQLRIQVYNADQTSLLFEDFVNVDYTIRNINTASIRNLVPASPATILLNEEVDITFNYTIDYPGGGRVYVRPMTKGSHTPGYAASGSPLYTGSGNDTAMFRITTGNNVHIDQLRIQVYDADQTSLLFEDFVNVDYTVIAARAWINSLNPRSPATVKFNENINITFGYETGLPEGCLVFIRPMTNGSLTPNYAASGSPTYTGSGTDSAMFRITIGKNVHIDQLRINVYDDTNTTLLYQTFVKVDYTVM